MHYVLYFSIALHYIVCCHLATATGASATCTVAQNVSALSSIRNGPTKTGMSQPHAFNTSVRMPVNPRFGRLMVKNTYGDEANSVQKMITPVLKTNKFTAYSSKKTDGDVNSGYTRVEETGKETQILTDGVLGMIKDHLLTSLQMVDDGNLKSLVFLIELIQITQSVPKNSIAYLVKSFRDIKDNSMNLSIVLSGLTEELGYNIEKDIETKFADIVGRVDDKKTLIMKEMKQIKQNTKELLSSMVKQVVEKITSKNKNTVLPGAPLSFICRGLIKWSSMMESNDKDAQRNQNGNDSLEENKNIVKDFVDGKYNPDILHFDPGAQVKLQGVNDVSLKFIHAFTILLSMYIEDNESSLEASDPLKLSFIEEMTNDLHLFFLSYNKLFVERYILEYVPKPQSVPNFEKFKKLIFPKSTNKTDDGPISSMVYEADPVVKYMEKFLPMFVNGCLNDLFVSDTENWLVDVKNQIDILVKESHGDTGSALTILRNEAFSHMSSFLNSNPEENPDENMPHQL